MGLSWGRNSKHPHFTTHFNLLKNHASCTHQVLWLISIISSNVAIFQPTLFLFMAFQGNVYCVWYLVIFKDYSLSAPWSSPAITNSVWGSHWFILHLMKSLARPWAALHEDATSFNRCFKEISTRGLRVNPTAPNGSQDNFSCRIKWIIEILRTKETSNVHC